MDGSVLSISEVRPYKVELLERLHGPGGATGPGASAFGRPLAQDASLLAQRCPSGWNVRGVGYGAKVTSGRVCAELCLRVYVRTKLSRLDLDETVLVPLEVNGMPTDVVAVGDIAAQPRPAPGGVSIGHRDTTAGTLGCWVRLNRDGVAHILSNNHVLANVNQAALGDPIMEPGPADGGVTPIAELRAFEPIKLSGEANVIDAAVARVVDPNDVKPEILDIGLVRNPPLEAAMFRSVRKHGRTTRHTVGTVVDLAADIWVQMGSQQMAWFEDQLGIEGTGSDFSRPGDSGSLIVDGQSRAAVGLLFAGGDAMTFANPIQGVLARFDATIIGE